MTGRKGKEKGNLGVSGKGEKKEKRKSWPTKQKGGWMIKMACFTFALLPNTGFFPQTCARARVNAVYLAKMIDLTYNHHFIAVVGCISISLKARETGILYLAYDSLLDTIGWFFLHGNHACSATAP